MQAPVSPLGCPQNEKIKSYFKKSSCILVVRYRERELEQCWMLPPHGLAVRVLDSSGDIVEEGPESLYEPEDRVKG